MKSLKSYLVLFLFIFLALWQISMLFCALKWDALDVVFPFRYHFSESIQSGYFPLWNPYQQTGVPYYADLQAPTYYPELLLVSLFSGYGLYVMNFLFILYLMIAGAGMYNLSFHFNKNRGASLIAGAAYALSGFVIGHGQHVFLLIGTAWIPFVLLNYLKMNSSGKLIYVLKTAVFLFLMITGSYQALTILLFYLLIFIFIYFIIQSGKLDKKKILIILKQNGFLLFIIIIFSLPLLFATLEVLTSVERLDEGVSLESTLKNSLSPKSLLSLILPFSTLKNHEFFGSDISMRNFYIGLIPLLFLIPALLKKRKAVEYILFAFALILLAASFGGYLPVRELMFNHVPFMNLYKYAPFVNVFCYLACILIAANYIAYFNKNHISERKKLILFTILLFIVLSALTIFAYMKLDTSKLTFLQDYETITERLNALSFYEHILIQGLIQIFIVFLLFILILRFAKIKKPIRLLVIIALFDLFIAAQFNGAFTVYNTDHNLSEIKKDFDLFPKKFPVPVNNRLIYNDRTHNANPPLWRNTYTFSKQISFDSFSSFKLKSLQSLHSNPNIKDAVLHNHLLYYSDSIAPLSIFNDQTIDPERDHRILFLEDDVYVKLKSSKTGINQNDSIKITEFSPSAITIETFSQDTVFLSLIQSFFPGRKAYIDGKEAQIYVSNFNYQSILLPKGRHSVRFEYKNNTLRLLYIISNVLFFIAVFYLFGMWIYNQSSSRELAFGIIFILSLILILLLFYRLSYIDPNEKSYVQSERKFASKESLASLENSFKMDDTDQSFFKLDTAKSFQALFEFQNSDYSFDDLTIRLTGFFYPKDYVQACIVSEIVRDGVSIDWHCRKLEKQIEKLHSVNRLEYLRNFHNLKENDIVKLYLWYQEIDDLFLSTVHLDIFEN